MENDSSHEEGELGHKCHTCKSNVYINELHECFEGATRVRVDEHLFLHSENGPVDPNLPNKLALRCSMCRALVDDEVPHGCFEGFDNIRIDDKDQDIQSNPTNTSSSSQQPTNSKYNDENEDPNSRNSCSERPNWSDTTVEVFIDEVKSRPPLWNYHLTIQSRSPISSNTLIMERSCGGFKM